MRPVLKQLCLCVAAICATARGGELDDPILDATNVELQTVLTPTRLRQSLSDVPGSVTVITAEMISRFGITSIPEALRLVPGMNVMQVSGGDYRINYHGTSILTPRRMNVLVDGLSVYRPGFARVDWMALPIALADVDRIEVTRGPNSASYGANSLLAIVNIISKHPGSVGTLNVSLSKGSHGALAQLASLDGTRGRTSYRMTADYSRDEGYDVSGATKAAHDRTSLKRLTINTSTELKDGSTLDLKAAFLEQFRDVEYVDAGQITFPDLASRDAYLNARWRKSFSQNHDIQISANAAQHTNSQAWTTCVPTAYLLPEMRDLWTTNKAMVPSVAAGKVPTFGTPEEQAVAIKALDAIKVLGKRAMQTTCVDTNQDLLERRLEAELQDTLVLSDATRIVTGMGIKSNTADSQTYLSGRFTDTMVYAFASAEYKWTPKTVVNAGGFYERTTFTGTAFSPRLAVNYHINEYNTLRLVASRSSHMPDIQEQKTNWSYTVTNLRPALPGVEKAVFFQTAKSPGGLQEEKIFSREIGYLGNFPEIGLMVDAKVFRDRLYDTISEKLQASDYAPTNNNYVNLNGVEVQLSYNPTERLMVHAGYSRLNNQTSSIFERTQYAKHNGSIAVSYLFDNDVNLAASCYRTDGLAVPAQSAFGRKDVTVSKRFFVGRDSSITPSFTVQRLDNPVLLYSVDGKSSRQVSYNNAYQYLFTVKFTY